MSPSRCLRLALTLALLVPLSGCVTYVRQGHVGLLIDNFSGEIDQVLDPGWRGSTPIRQQIVEYPVIVQQYVMVREPERDDAVRVNSREGQTFIVDAAVEFMIRGKSEVPALYKRYGLDFDHIVENYYRSKFKAALVTAVASLPLNDAIAGNGRRQVEQMALADLRRTMANEHVEILQVLIRGVYLPEAISNAISDKTRAENALEQSRTNAEQRVVEAQAAARAQVVAAEAAAKSTLIRAAAEAKANREVAASLTDRLIRKLYVEKLADKIQLVLPEHSLLNLGGLLPAAIRPARDEGAASEAPAKPRKH